MPDYRRVRIPGAIYFFTVVTYERKPFLTTARSRRCLRQAWLATRRKLPFESLAVCLLPDHLHCIWRLPESDADFSSRWRSIKGRFTRLSRAHGRPVRRPEGSRARRREASVWQRRFWEHWIRDEEDLRRHLDYVHYNPVKHGYVRNPEDWQWTSFHRYLARGWYEVGWGHREPEAVVDLDAGE